MSEHLLSFSQQLLNSINPKLPEDVVAVQRGLLLYRQSMVYQLKHEPNRINASVQDVIPCEVELHLQQPTDSSCSCLQGTFCRHQLATFFTAYADIGSVSDWIQSWKNAQQGGAISSQSLQLQKAKELLLSDKPLERDYASWKAFIEETFTIQIDYSLNQSSYTLTTKWDVYLQRLKAKMPLEAPWKMLFLFVCYFQSYLLILRKLKKKNNSTTAKRFLEEEAFELIENMFYLMEQLTRISRPFAFDEFYNDIRQDLAELLEEQHVLEQSPIDVYRAIWTHLLKEKTWRKEEMQSLEMQITSSPNETLLIASIHLSFLSGNIDAVTKRLQDVQPKDYHLLTYWIRQFDEQKAAPFLQFVIEHIERYIDLTENPYRKKEFIQFFLPPVRRYCLNQKRFDVFERFCEACLPYSFVYYSHYLLDMQKYRKWVELCIHSNVEVEYLSKDELKLIQENEPTLLLPLYTNAVNEKIEGKNRQSYRGAVRYLKKIRTIYKKEKKMEQWERYIDHIQSANTRLRAFQEELKRGKLIHAE